MFFESSNNKPNERLEAIAEVLDGMTDEQMEKVLADFNHISGHVKWLLDNSEPTVEAGNKQFAYLTALPHEELVLVIGGLLGHITGLQERLDT